MGSQPEPAPLPQGRAKLPDWRQFLNIYAIFLVLLVLSAFLSKHFFTMQNVMNLLLRCSFNGLLSLGMTMVILTGGIDLSVGSVFAFAGAFLATMEHGHFFQYMPQLTAGFEQSTTLKPVMPTLLIMLAALAAGTVVGLLNGLMVTKAKIPAFIATLSTMVAVRGLAFTYTAGFPISGASRAVRALAESKLGPLPLPVLIWFLMVVVCWSLSRYSVFGKSVYAVGGAETTARFSGIDVDGVRLRVYMISGFLAALAGVIMVGRMVASEPREGAGYELDAIAATVIGGTALSGGRGGVLGTVVGVLILGLIANILNLMEVAPYPQQMAKGLIILVSVLMQATKK